MLMISVVFVNLRMMEGHEGVVVSILAMQRLGFDSDLSLRPIFNASLFPSNFTFEKLNTLFSSFLVTQSITETYFVEWWWTQPHRYECKRGVV